MTFKKEFNWQYFIAGICAALCSMSAAEDTPPLQCFEINKLSIEGVNLLPKSEFKNLNSLYSNRCLSIEDINNLMSTVSTWYQSKGYVTTRAYLPQQDLSSGQLVIQVIEGQAEAVVPAPDSVIQVLTAFPGITKKPLNLRDIEQGIDQLNRLSANQTWMELSPGETTGGSIINVFNNRSKGWSASLRLDNSGQESTGLYQARASVTSDNLMRVNDYLSFSYQTDLEENATGKLSDSVSLHLDVPYGYWLMVFDANTNRYKNRVEGDNQTFDTSGDGNSLSLGLSRVIYRDQKRKTELLSNLTRKENRNFVEEVLLETSSRALSIAKLTVRHQEMLPNNQTVNLQLDFKQGVDLFGAASRAEGSDAPDPLYSSLAGQISYSKPFNWLSVNHAFSSSFNAHWSDDILFGSEQFSVGGLYTVRGFKGESVSGNEGAYLRNDLTSNYLLPKNAFGLRSISTTLGWDVGGIWNSSNSIGNEELLQGTSLGVRLGSKYLSTEATYARAISKPDSFTDDRNQFHIALTVKL